jgi:thiol-disulfide isomerase/thioredoxin
MTSETFAQRWLVCLCAAWCGTCRDYRPLFDSVVAQHPLAHALWLDIEDEADRVGDIDVETFPTLLIVDRADSGALAVRFFGPLLPHVQTFARLVEALGTPDAHQRDAAGTPPEVRALAASLTR